MFLASPSGHWPLHHINNCKAPWRRQTQEPSMLCIRSYICRSLPTAGQGGLPPSHGEQMRGVPARDGCRAGTDCLNCWWLMYFSAILFISQFSALRLSLYALLYDFNSSFFAALRGLCVKLFAFLDGLFILICTTVQLFVIYRPAMTVYSVRRLIAAQKLLCWLPALYIKDHLHWMFNVLSTLPLWSAPYSHTMVQVSYHTIIRWCSCDSHVLYYSF
jgi:uncharacterized membrane protein